MLKPPDVCRVAEDETAIEELIDRYVDALLGGVLINHQIILALIHPSLQAEVQSLLEVVDSILIFAKEEIEPAETVDLVSAVYAKLGLEQPR